MMMRRLHKQRQHSCSSGKQQCGCGTPDKQDMRVSCLAAGSAGDGCFVVVCLGLQPQVGDRMGMTCVHVWDLCCVSCHCWHSSGGHF